MNEEESKVLYEDLLTNYYEKIEVIEAQDIEILDLKNINEKLSLALKSAENKVERLHSIIKEVREFIYKCNDGKQGINYSGCSKLLEILDKEKE